MYNIYTFDNSIYKYIHTIPIRSAHHLKPQTHTHTQSHVMHEKQGGVSLSKWLMVVIAAAAAGTGREERKSCFPFATEGVEESVCVCVF